MNVSNIVKNLVVGTALVGTLSGCAAMKPSGAIETYMDTRGKPTETILASADLPLGTRFYGFGDFGTPVPQGEFYQPYSEMRITKRTDSGVGVSAEYNRDFSLDKGIIRAGIFYEPDLSKYKSILGVRFSPYSTNNKGSQLVFYGKTNLGKTMDVNGWFKYNFKPHTCVSEVKFSKRLKKLGNYDLYASVEGRHFGFLKKDKTTVGAGVEVRRKFK